MGLGAKAPYLYLCRGYEMLHLVSSTRVSIPLKKIGIYKPGRILKVPLLGESYGGFKLIHEVIPIMEIPATFVVSLSWVGRSCRGFVNFGPSGEYSILCVLDRDQVNFPVSRSIGTNTRCLVSIEHLLGAEHGIPIVSVSVHSLLQ